ncbi:MAG: YdeI/OmpD-associated family protein [Planctomycetota bacterium]
MSVKTKNFSKVPVNSADELRKWLAEHHAQAESVWLVTFKKSTPDRYVSTGEVLDELLAYGWIDGLRRKLDEQRTMQLISPRQAQHWSKTYKERVAKLEKEGRMAEPGRAAVERSKANGMWNFLDDVDALIQPEDLQKALDAQPEAKKNFNGFPTSKQRFALRWIKLAKSEKARGNRIQKTVDCALEGKGVPGS